MAAEWFPLEERGLITGVQGMATAMGIFVGFGVSPVVYKATSSWPITMVYMAVPAIVFLVFTVIMQFGPKAPEMILEEKEDPKAAAMDFKKAISEPVIYLCIVYVFLFNWLIQGMFMLGSLSSGWLNTKIYKGNTKLQIMMALLTSVYFLVRLPGVFEHGPNILLFCVLCISAFFMGQGIATIMAFISKNYPEHITGKVGGMAMGPGLIGGTVGVGVGSRAITQTGNYQASILIVSIVGLIGFIIAIGLKKPRAFEHLHEK